MCIRDRDTIALAVENAGYSFGNEIMIALDCAAAEFYENNLYNYKKFEGDQAEVRTSKQQADYLASLASKYPIISIEDGLDESDWPGWEYHTEKLGGHIQLVGDDLFVTNPRILSYAIDRGVANAILIKLNQIGTLTETLDAISIAKRAVSYTHLTLPTKRIV